MELSFRYGTGTQTVDVDPSLVVARVGAGAHRAIEDIPGALRKSVAYPTGPYLEEIISHGDRVLFMTVDDTRPNPSPMLHFLMERVEDLGGRPEVMVGLGLHRPMRPERLLEFLGIEVAHQNDSRSDDQWCLGRTANGTPLEISPVLREFDKRIVVGFIEPHYIAGFSGGRKMVLPGCASRDSITHNHFLTALHGPQLGRLEGNPVHEDMMQAALAVGIHWICDAVVNPDDTWHAITCGDLRAAHEAGVRAARSLYTEEVPKRADIVICCAGGYPYDVDMVQAKKTLVPAMDCVRPGGVIILLGECSQGWGASTPEMGLMDPEGALELRARILDDIRSGRLEHHWGPCSPGILFMRVVYDLPATLIVVSQLQEQLRGTYLHPAPDLPAALEMARDLLGRDATVTAIHDGRRAICRVG
ncbi:MAG: nickel-dependent lactate racemase [Armatimonadetes bacterium]|nr:nickel-dependent lactate racemase [Armatimonadota bacterium]